MDSSARAALSIALARLKDGDRAAARPVFHALWPVLVAFARRTLADDRAEEAAQRAIVRLFAQIDRYDEERDALSWAFAIAVWEIRSLARDDGRARARCADMIDPVDPRAVPHEQASERELRALLEHAVASLAESDRRTILEMLDDADPGAPLSARLRQRRHRAIARLRTIWKELHGTP